MKIDFSTDGMEILVSFFSEENRQRGQYNRNNQSRASTNLYGDIPKRQFTKTNQDIVTDISFSGTQKGGGKKDRRVKEENTPPSEANTG